MIKLKNIPNQTVECFDNQNNSLGFANFDEFNDLRVQIKQHKAEGFFVMFNGKKITINKHGQVENHNVDFFDLFDNHN